MVDKPKTMRILLVDDTRTDRMIMNAYLKKLEHEIIVGENGEQAIDLYRKCKPDLVLLDVIMPVMDGHEVARRIRALKGEWVPIIFLSARTNAGDIAAGIEAGGDDYLTKPVDQTVLAAKMRAMQRIAAMRQRLLDVSTELESANAALQRLVDVDGLTGLANRRHLDRHLAQEAGRCARYKQPLSVIMADVDHFKTFNDLFGHLAGDDCLVSVSRVFEMGIKRSSDLAARYGGEEFCLVLPDTSAHAAQEKAEEIRLAVEALGITHAGTSVSSEVVTLSLGVATRVPKPGISPETLLLEADKALYHAKKAGRNKAKSFLSTANNK